MERVLSPYEIAWRKSAGHPVPDDEAELERLTAPPAIPESVPLPASEPETVVEAAAVVDQPAAPPPPAPIEPPALPPPPPPPPAPASKPRR